MKEVIIFIAFALVLLILYLSVSKPNTKDITFDSCNGYTTKVIDSCEYIEYDNGLVNSRVYSLTHKGNCRFCIQRNK